MIDKTFTEASDNCLEIYKALTERDGGCETCVIFFNVIDDKVLYSEPLGIGRLLPNMANSDVVMEFCRQAAKQIQAVAYVVTTNIRMLDETYLKEIERQKEEDPDEEPDSPVELMETFSEHVLKGIAQFLVFRWGTTYQRFIIHERQGFGENTEFFTDTSFQTQGWEGD